MSDSPGPREDVTRILEEWRTGDHDALARLTPFVYDELRRIASGYMRGERVTHTLQATALVHEAYLRLAGTRDTKWQDRVHFFAIASQTMRRILVDHARTARSQRRGGEFARISLEEAEVPGLETPPDLIALDEALEALEAIDPAKSRLLELRYFGGLTLEEVAEVMGISTTKVWQDEQFAKAFLFDHLDGNVRAG